MTTVEALRTEWRAICEAMNRGTYRGFRGRRAGPDRSHQARNGTVRTPDGGGMMTDAPNYNDGLWHGWNGGECPVAKGPWSVFAERAMLFGPPRRH